MLFRLHAGLRSPCGDVDDVGVKTLGLGGSSETGSLSKPRFSIIFMFYASRGAATLLALIKV